MTDPVNLQIPLCVLLRLLRQHSLVVSDFRCLDQASKRACCRALKACLMDTGVSEVTSLTPTPSDAAERTSAAGD